DLFLTNHLATYVSLYKQSPFNVFQDVATSSGMNLTEDDHGSAWGDCDNDGFPDLYITEGADSGTGTKQNRLYHNLQNGNFVDIASAAGVTDPNGRGRSVSWVDYNNDGFLDLYLANAESGTYNDKLFKNVGNCTFVDVSSQAGDITKKWHKLGQSWIDYDNDGYMDVVMTGGSVIGTATQDFGVNLYHNNHDGTFTDVTQQAGIIGADTGNGMAWGDYNNDGLMDLFVTTGNQGIPTTLKGMSNRLYRNNGNGTFTEVASQAGVSQNENSQDALWGDFNNDGFLDLYVVNAGDTTGKRPNYLYLNNGNGTFTNVALTSSATGGTTGIMGGAALGDFDNDGFLDISLTNGLPTANYIGQTQILHNLPGVFSNNWLKVKLIGITSNKLGVGARVVLNSSSFPQQVREQNGGVHHFAQDDQTLEFGLKQDKTANLTIYWPSGKTQTLNNISSNQTLTVTEN
ncbi:MAG: CRTAC1 family protein, partial [Candidatus Moranbacteria bacterium]|nr:CRTAC1 family protein [Candidatus Moranbacteria bacterium]